MPTNPKPRKRNPPKPKIHKATDSWMQAMEIIWGEEPYCSICMQLFKEGEDYVWPKPADLGGHPEHIECPTLKKRAR